MDNFAVLGLGQFGFSIAEHLMENNCEVLAIDKSSEKIDDIKDTVTMAVIGNVADRATFDKFVNRDIDCAIIGLGENLEDSVLCTMYAAEAGIKNIIAKASNRDHGKILSHIGATRVVYPSSEIAKRLATSLTNPNLLDYLPIHEGYSLTEVSIPDEFVGKSMSELDLRNKYGITVIGIKEQTENGDQDDSSISMFPSPDMKFGKSMILVAIGKDEEIKKLNF